MGLGKYVSELFALASCRKQTQLPKYFLLLNITRRREKPYTRYSPQFKNFGGIPVDGRITLKHIHGRRLYRREFNYLELFLLGGIVDYLTDVLCPFVPQLGGSQGTSRTIPHA